MDTFKAEARKLGATRFVKIPLAPNVGRLLDELAERLVELEEDGDPTSGTAATVEEVDRREEDFARRGAAAAAKIAETEQHADASAPWGFVSGFCGADSVSFAAEPLGGFPLAGFDADELVRRLWEERTGIHRWAPFRASSTRRSTVTSTGWRWRRWSTSVAARARTSLRPATAAEWAASPALVAR